MTSHSCPVDSTRLNLICDAMVIVGRIRSGMMASFDDLDLAQRAISRLESAGHEAIAPRMLAHELWYFYNPYAARKDHPSRTIRLLDRITRWIDPRA